MEVAERAEDYDVWEVVEYESGALAIHNKPDWRVCFMATASTGQEADDILDNAHLISAAPDMREALRNLVNAYETQMLSSPADETLANVMARAKAALKKAKG